MPHEFAKSVRHLWLLCAPKPVAERVDMTGRTVIVTGASPKSIGYETAKALASWGADVIATSLHDAKTTETCLKSDLSRIGADGTISVRPLDLCDTNSVSNFAEWFVQEYEGTLHVLLNNAGIHKNIFSPRQKPPLSADGFEIHWRTNYLGPFHLTNLLLPSLKRGAQESGDARVINVASHLHDRVSNEELINPTKTYHSWNAYGASKLALIHFSFEMNRRFEKKFNLRSAALHPGSVHTNLTQTQSINGRIGHVLNRVNYAMTSLVLLHRKYGAQTLIMCASTPTLQGGRYYERCRVRKSSNQSRQTSASKALWGQSEAWLQSVT
ncbi:MAG: SDR family NAD(P)-dependent oxidoreductase [Rhodothermaceae bacterium]|nr:SDR family NAD(P)-dependent oxidoreductase [Rhodothermaceae bacterium]MYD18995.1 SDR family NAD(P)-dependent oxidoreductase [Rhodothermaceae bacterium]MYD55389.1 SDR family NAD(P)-dependent oxidoreductase [Rhodothermaceae bacterium]MYI43117.1 SDR family NAD(P)-dependent oxidoreductase [Rhodothermaceae bacterium]MYJ56931.1 SDR family NAD(P)-dependent oxidoreductase [Rhodothermaceae bacterium]